MIGIKNIVLLTFSSLLLFSLIINTAWVSDDAFITFRTVENFYSGIGLTWNPHERVQTYTHPLWMMLLLLGGYVTSDLYSVSIYFSFILMLSLVFVLKRHFLVIVSNKKVAMSKATLCILFFVSSKAFIDFSTSGLENPLSYLLFALLFVSLQGKESFTRSRNVFLIIGFILLVRHDFLLLVLPILLYEFLFGSKSLMVRFGYALIGAMPLFVWTLFSIVYYGFPFPNTAYAKLGGSIPLEVLFSQGLKYYTNSFSWDTSTLTVVFLSIPISFLWGKNNHKVLCVGIMLYLSYILYIGGDFMSGRFFTVPFLLSTLLVVSIISVPKAVLLSIVSVFLSLVQQHSPLYFDKEYSGYGIVDGIADERGEYYEMTGWLLSGEDVLDKIPSYLDGRMFKEEKDLFAWRDALGFFGYGAGPDKIVHDTFALTSPFLARMPLDSQSFQSTSFRPGHLKRIVNKRFYLSEKTGKNKFKRPAQRRIYNKLAIITRNPLWSLERFRAILELHCFGSIKNKKVKRKQ